MLIAALGSAALLGLFGGVHCTFMCGPLAVRAASGQRPVRGSLAYLAGRFVGHVTAGAVLGLVGLRVATLASGAALQAAVALAVALVLLERAIRLFFGAAKERLVPLGRRPSRRWSDLALSLLPRRPLPLGLATSALPCGLLAAAWALAASAANPVSGALVMATFSLVTAPALTAAVVAGAALARVKGRVSPRAQAALWVVLAVGTALRPLLAATSSCCH